MCKHSNVLSRPVLMVRGLDGYFDLSRPCRAVFKVREGLVSTVFGGDSEGATPLPIPNRAVKPLSADGTWASGPGGGWSPPLLQGHVCPGPPPRAPRLLPGPSLDSRRHVNPRHRPDR